MKDSWFKVISIALAVALVFTIVTSNIVSLTAISVLKKAKAGTIVQGGDPSDTTKATDSGNAGQVDNPNAGDNTEDTTAAGTDSTTSSGGGSGGSGGSSNTTTTAKKSDSNMPSTKAEVFDFYKAAIQKVQGGTAGHTRKEWQSIDALSFGGKDNDTLKGIIQGFVTAEDKAGEAISEKGSDESKNRIAPCGAPITKVKTATCVADGNNYKITIVMNDEVNPEKGSNGVAAMATGILYLEDVRDTIANDKTVSFFVKSLDDSSTITYKAYTITATMTKDGKFIDIRHIVAGDIVASAKLIVGSVNGAGTLTFNSHWYDFKY
ncbi:MAG TPA: hypothetical protein VFD25_00325 [Clostridia bacterium]|nr:hypothetical protein [Clostridia bacterium]